MIKFVCSPTPSHKNTHIFFFFFCTSPHFIQIQWSAATLKPLAQYSVPLVLPKLLWYHRGLDSTKHLNMFCGAWHQDILIYLSSSSHGCASMIDPWFRLMFLKPFLNNCWHVAGYIILLKMATDIREQHCHERVHDCTWSATFFREVICLTCTWPSTWSKIKCNSTNQATFFHCSMVQSIVRSFREWTGVIMGTLTSLQLRSPILGLCN